MKTYGLVEIQLHASAALPPKKDLGTPWIGGWVGPRTGLDAGGNEEIIFHSPCQKSNPYLPVCSLVTVLTELQ
jgi:hypothetical protein